MTMTKDERIIASELILQVARSIAHGRTFVPGFELRKHLCANRVSEPEKSLYAFYDSLHLNYYPWDFEDRWNRNLKYVKGCFKSASGRYVIQL